MQMARKNIIVIASVIIIILGFSIAYYLRNSDSLPANLQLATAARRELKLVVSTNGIVEPIERTDIFAPVDGFAAVLKVREGSRIGRGELLVRLQSQQTMTSLAEAKAALLQARFQAHAIVAGPPKEELAAVDSSTAESELQLKQLQQELLQEKSLLQKEATTRWAVENLQKQVDLLELRIEALRQKKQNLLNRYSAEEKQWEGNRVIELTKQVDLLEQQLRMGSVLSPRSGVLFSLPIKPESYINKGQLLAEIYEPGQVRLCAYVDEPDLGRIELGQQTIIEWDGMPDKQWAGEVERRAEQVVALGNRSVGFVFCRIEGRPDELIPNINVKVQIVTSRKTSALVVPRSAVFNQNGQPTVMVVDGENAVLKTVVPGLITPQEIEILKGIDEGSRVVINPGEANKG
jgi:HlyD family secretion protein